MSALHVYTIVKRRNDGGWNVICHECSQAAFEYTYPCQQDPGGLDGQPPRVLFASAAAAVTETREEVR